jgi:hypothetical protein
MNAASPVYVELIDFISANTPPGAMVGFRPSEANQTRLQLLVEGQRNGTLTPDEEAELDEFLQLEHIMILAKAQARHRLQRAG